LGTSSFEPGGVSDGSSKPQSTVGERGVVDLTGVMGYYCFVSMMLNTTAIRCRTERNPS
jgi:hypothetical protein